MSFKEEGFEVVHNVIDSQLLLHLKTEFEMIRDVKFFNSNQKNEYSFGVCPRYVNFSTGGSSILPASYVHCVRSLRCVTY